jgi:hypothetical protein
MMNNDNYCTREAARRLADKGIVLKTEAVWWQRLDETEWMLDYRRDLPLQESHRRIPAVQFAEVWRELPAFMGDFQYIFITKGEISQISIAGYGSTYITRTTNTTDSLIDLLIWVRSQ